MATILVVGIPMRILHIVVTIAFPDGLHRGPRSNVYALFFEVRKHAWAGLYFV